MQHYTRGARGGSLKAETDPLAQAAKLYESSFNALDQAQSRANASALGLTGTQARLMETMADPLFAQMPETWRSMIAAQGEYVIQLEQVSADHQRLNELIAATPTAQLETKREEMLFLADAFEKGKITAEQFSEAAQAALGNIPAKAESVSDAFIDMQQLGTSAAQTLADGFTKFLFDPVNASIKDMLVGFLKAVAQMMVQQMALKAATAALKLFGFAKGGVFDGGLQAFASGGVVTRPTYFKFASGGSVKTGLMGEAGPEAILPLKRGANGRLRVAANGMGSGEINIFIVINQNGASNESKQNSNAQASALADGIKVAVLRVLVEQQRPGGMLYK